MYGKNEVSRWPRRAFAAAHLLILALSAWFLLGPGTTTVGSWTGVAWSPGDGGRRLLLLAFGVVLWARMSATGLLLLRRRFTWGEMGLVTFGAGMYQLGFGLLGAGSRAPLDGWDVAAVVLFLGGGALNTLSEWARLRFKSRPENRGHLYTHGAFAVVRHPNYLGDVLWGIGWMVLARSPWGAVIVAVELSGFVFVNIPQLSRYLEGRYGEEYRRWAAHTPRLIPWVY